MSRPLYFYQDFLFENMLVDKQEFYDYEYEMEKQYERDSWIDTRSRWN